MTNIILIFDVFQDLDILFLYFIKEEAFWIEIKFVKLHSEVTEVLSLRN